MNKGIFQKQIFFLFDKLLNLLLSVSGLVILWLIGLIFFWASFKVPSHSMEPEIMAGDRVESSEDSRYWGLVPEPFIVGKVGFISESRDPNTGQFRWNRWLKRMGPDYP